MNFAGRKRVGIAIKKTRIIPKYKKKLNNKDLNKSILIRLTVNQVF